MVRTVIVTDGEQRAALAVVRSLGAAGYRCIVTSSSSASIAGGSRFVARTVAVPNALERPTEFAEAIVALVAAEEAAVVLPIAEQSLLAILPIARSTVSGDRSVSRPRRVQRVDGQGTTARGSFQARNRDPCAGNRPRHRLSRLDGSLALRYPIVLKPARSVSERAGVRAKFSVTYASDASELQRKLRALPPAAFPLLLQQRVVGPGTGIFLLLWDGKLKAQFAHQRLSEKPPSGGVSVYRESVSIDEGLRDRSRALLDRFGWRGVAMVEYKRDSATGQPYLMEVNGRFWGSLQLAIDSGVDFPRILVACALGEHNQQMPSYRVGVRSRWWWGQIDQPCRASSTFGCDWSIASRCAELVSSNRRSPPGTISARGLRRSPSMDRPWAVLERDRSLDRPSMTAMPPLRIAMMLESDGPGGAEMMVFRLSEELRRRVTRSFR